MAGSPWICPRCGAASNGDVCPNCLLERPIQAGGGNEPGSYFGLTQGPQGYAGMPRSFGIGCLLFIVTLFLLGLYRNLHR